MEKEKQIDPRDLFFGAMLQMDVSSQFVYFNSLKKHWLSINYHLHLYDCLEYCVNKSINFDLLSANNWFRENQKYTSNFKVSDLSKLTANVNRANIEILDVAINLIAYTYFKDASFLFSNKISMLANDTVNFDLDAIRNEIDSFQKRIDEDYIEEIEQTNDQIIDEILISHENAKVGKMPGISIGFNCLSHVLLEPVDFMVIGARPSMGKTAFSLSALHELVFKQNRTVAFYSLEMSKVQIMRRILAVATGIGDEDIKLGRCNEDELFRIKAFKKHPNWQNLTIYEGLHKPSDIIRKTTILSQKKAVDLILVDYLQKIAPERSSMKMIESVSNASNQMKNLAMNLKIPVVALAQLSRSVEQRGGDKRPVLSDLRESGEIEQDASIVAFLHRPEYYGITEDEAGESLKGVGEFILAKNRGGRIENTRMSFIGHLMRWGDLNQNFSSSTMPVNTGFDKKSENNLQKNVDVPF